MSDDTDTQTAADPVLLTEPADESATARLRAFENEHWPKAVRIDGEVEDGRGSLYERESSPELRAEHDALKKCVKTEAAVVEAKAALLVAEEKHAEALDRAERCQTPTE